MSIKILAFLSVYLSQFIVFGACLPQAAESYYTVKDYEVPYFHVESLCLDQDSFVQLVDQVNEKTRDRAFHIEVPNELYSENIGKLRAAEFFHYCDYPERNASLWCRTNCSGIPLVATHTFGARCIIYYKENSEYYFLLIKDKYGFKDYEVPGGSVQVDDKDIIEAFEKGHYKTANVDYRSPEEGALSEVMEEAGFDLTKYGYGLSAGDKKPLVIAQIYSKNTRPWQGIHSVNDCRQYLLFQVSPNKDPLKKQDHEVMDVRWASYTEIVNDQIDSPIGIHKTTDNIKRIVERVVAADKYKESRRELITINKKLQELITSGSTNTNELKQLLNKQLELEKVKTELESKLRQNYSRSNNSYTTYFTPF